MVKRRLFRFRGIGKGDILKDNGTVRHLAEGMFPALKAARRFQYLRDSFNRCARNKKENKHIRQEHKAHEYLHRVRHETGELSRRQTESGVIAGSDNLLRPQPREERRTQIKAEHHQRSDTGKDNTRFHKIL